MTRILITGVNGFIGRALAEDILGTQDVEVFGTYRGFRGRPALPELEGLTLLDVELLDPSAVMNMLRQVQPDSIFHLAGQSSVTASLAAPAQTLDSNVTAQIHLLEALRTLDLHDTRFLVPGSCEEYGAIDPGDNPITEDHPLRPLSPYGVSKVAQDLLGWQYHRSYGIPIVRTRSFHQAGPRRSPAYIPAQFAKQLAEIEAGKREPILLVGNLQVVRDYTDVRDTARAYRMVLASGEPGEVYNLGTGRGVVIEEMLQMLLALSDVDVEVRKDPARWRPAEADVLICDPSKLKAATGWEPVIDLATTLGDTLDHWRSEIKTSA